MPFAAADDGVRLHWEESGSGKPRPVHPRVRRRPSQLGAAGPRTSAAATAASPTARAAIRRRTSRRTRARTRRTARRRRRRRGARRRRRGPRARRRPVHGRLLRRCTSGCAIPAARGRSSSRAWATAPTRAPEAFRAESEAVAAAFDAEGAAEVAERYAVGPARVQFQNKDRAAGRSSRASWPSTTSAGSALTMRGVQRARPSLYDLTRRARAR